MKFTLVFIIFTLVHIYSTIKLILLKSMDDIFAFCCITDNEILYKKFKIKKQNF